MKVLFKTIVFTVLIIVLVEAGTLLYVLSFYSEKSLDTFDCAVVFGAAVWPGGNPSHALSDRVNEAIDIYENKRVGCLVFSGADSAYGKHEIDVMLDIAYERKVELEDIELDYQGLNTQQTIRHLDPSRSYLLISNDFHLARIHLLAWQQGISNFALHSSDYRMGRYSREPYFLLRETIAFWYYVFFTGL